MGHREADAEEAEIGSSKVNSDLAVEFTSEPACLTVSPLLQAVDPHLALRTGLFVFLLTAVRSWRWASGAPWSLQAFTFSQVHLTGATSAGAPPQDLVFVRQRCFSLCTTLCTNLSRASLSVWAIGNELAEPCGHGGASPSKAGSLLEPCFAQRRSSLALEGGQHA